MSNCLRLKAIVIVLTGLLSTPLFAQGTIGDTSPAAEGETNTVKIIEPKKDVPVAKSAAIDDERFELGLFAGVLSVEDFNSNAAYGLSLSYHITPRFMAQINYGQTEVERATFEENANANFLSSSDREFTYYHVLAGYRVLRGRSFLGVNSKYNSDIYLLGGFGSVDFADEDNTSIVLGASYRVVLTDALVGNIDFRSHIVDRDFLDDDKRTFNNELAIGLNLLF